MKKADSTGAIDAVACLLIAATVWFLYRKVLGLWWMFDDPFHFNILNHAGIIDTLGNRGIYRMLGTPLFTPLLFLSLKLDLTFFGLNARAFYLHQLIALLLIGPVQYLMLRRWSGWLAAFSASMVTMIGPPMLNVAPVLMLRHYIEGAVLAFGSSLLFVRAVQSDRRGQAVASGVMYFLAACAKEIYVPLPALLLVVPEASWRRRARFLIPHAIGAAAYATWRLLVIGAGVGPYGFVSRPGQRFLTIATLPFRAVSQFAGFGTPAALALTIALVMTAIVIVIRLPRARLPVVVGVAIALAPVLPVATQLQPRWAFPLWLLATTAVAFLPRAVPPPWGIAVAIVILTVAAVSYRTEWPRVFRRFERMSNEARVFAALGPDDIILDPETPPVTLDELATLLGTRGRAFYDDFDLCRKREMPRRVFEFDPVRREVRDLGAGVIAAACDHIRAFPLSARITFDEPDSFFWHLGPYRDGGYAFILGQGRQAYEVPRDGGFRSPNLPSLTIRVRYRSPAGWSTYSPEFFVDMRKRQPITWQR